MMRSESCPEARSFTDRVVEKQMKQRQSQLASIVMVAVLVIVGWQTICEARNLFQLVDRDAVACLHTRQLDEQWKRLRDSEFGSRLKQAAFFQDWINSPDYKQLQMVRAAVEAASGKPLDQSRRELLGQDVVLAWYHAPGTKADLARNSVLLIEVPNPAVAKSALATWNTLEKQTTEARKYRDVAYTHSVKASAGQNTRGFCYVILDNVLAISIREDRIQRTIELATEADDESGTSDRGAETPTGHPECLAVYEPFAKAFARRRQTELAAVYVNPRILGSEVGRANKDFQTLEATLARCQWFTGSLAFDESITLEFVADYNSNGAPEWWQQWVKVAETAQSSGATLPPNALFAMSGRIASLSLSDMILKSLSARSELPRDLVQARRVIQGLLLGLDPVADVLPAIGPSWMFSIEPRDPEVSTSFPVDSLFAIEMQPTAKSEERAGDSDPVSTEAALDSSLQAGLGILAAVHNAHATGQPVSVVRQQVVDGVTIRYADPVAFFQPAFAISKGHLVMATSPDLCEAFLKSRVPAQDAGASSTGNQEPEPGDSLQPGNLQNVMASSNTARLILKQHRDWFIRQARRDKVPEAEAERRLEEMSQFLKLLDRAWLTASVDSSTFRVSAGISAETAVANER